MSRQNIELLERMYTAFNRGQFSTVMDAIDPDVEWRITSEAGPAPGTYHGHKGMRRVLDSFHDVWGEYQDTPLEFIDEGDYVVARICSEGTGRRSGAEVAEEFAHLWEIREGKVVRFQAFRESVNALDAAGIDSSRLHTEDDGR